MKSKRLTAIADMVQNEPVIDIGTDHAYIPIYLVTNKNFQEVYASDISAKVLEQAKKNIQKYGLENKITLMQNAGLKNINIEFKTAIIAGMGTNTIKEILTGVSDLPETLIIQSNNDLVSLRTFMQDIGYQISEEKVLLEKGQYYIIIHYEKGRDHLSTSEIKFGKSYDKAYLTYLGKKYQKIYELSHKKEYLDLLAELNNFIEKIPD